MFDIAVVHVGPPKTGSTALQHQAFANRDGALRDAGILYPSIDDGRRELRNHNRHLEAMFIDPEVLALPMLGRPAGASQPAGVDELFELYDRALSTSDCDHLFLSAEHLARARPEQIAAFGRWLGNYARSVRVVAVARHPLERAASQLQQIIRTGRTFAESSAMMRLDALSFGIGNFEELGRLVVLDYPTTFGSPAGPLRALLGRAIPEVSLGPLGGVVERLNASMSHEGVVLFEALNKMRPTTPRLAGPLRFWGDSRAFGRLKGTTFRPPARLGPVIDEIVERELAAWGTLDVEPPAATRQVVLDEPERVTGWLDAVARSIGDQQNLAYLDRRVRQQQRQARTGETTPELHEVARLLDIATWAQIDDSDVAARRSLRLVENLGVYGAYERAKRRIERHADEAPEGTP